MAYAKRYPGGYVDLPTQTTAVDSTFLNAVEAALLKLFDTDPTVDGQVPSWIAASTKYGPALLLNKNIDPAAGIVKSKLDFTGANGLVNADVAGAAAIVRSKLDFGAGLVNTDISASAGISRTKLARDATILFNAGVFSVPYNAFTMVTFDSETIDDSNVHSTSVSTTKIIIATAGLYLCGGFAGWGNNAGGDRLLEIAVNGTAVAGSLTANTLGSGVTDTSVTHLAVLAPGDFVELRAYQNQTSTLAMNITGGTAGTKLWAVRL